MPYPESDFLPLSSLRHFLFCRRQYALVHVSQLSSDNLYQNVDHKLITKWVNSRYSEGFLRQDLQVHSYEMGIVGICEVVEFLPSVGADGITISGKKGRWKPVPIMFKDQLGETDWIDEAHLCALAMCMEQMLCCRIDEGLLLEVKGKRKIPVEFNEKFRKIVEESYAEMHGIIDKQHIPKVKMKSRCEECPMYDVCLPELSKSIPVAQYLKDAISAME